MPRRPTPELVLTRARAVPGHLLHAWRRSIRTRVVVSIVVLSALVVGAVGLLVIRQITDGLVTARVNNSVAEATSQTENAQERLGLAGSDDFDSVAQLRQLVENLVARGQVRGFEVVVVGPLRPPGQGSGAASSGAAGVAGASGVRSTPGVDPASVPQRLRTAVLDTSGVAWTYTRVRYRPLDAGDDTPGSVDPVAGSATPASVRTRTRPSVAAVAVGSQLVLPSDGGTYALYYLFPMDQEQDTLALLRRSLISAALVLLALVAGVAWLVTRQVITPVRLARRVAERIASGRLEERMQVSGEDDLARLGTSFNQMADALQQQIRQLVELSRVQRTFVSDVSHELRTPLTTVRMASDVLHDARTGFDPVTARAAELLQLELDRFETLLSDLLEISRFDAGAAALDLEDVDLAEVARRVVEAARPVARQRGVEIDVRVQGRPRGCVAEVDVRRVERIVRNLVSNAIDHAGAPGSRVEVRLAAEPAATALTVRDYGVGLEPGQAAMVFNRFWRADPARARTSGGTGLGLSISLEDARLHGGWLQAWGVPGRGSSFRLTLPRRAGDALTHSPLPLVPADAGRAVGPRPTREVVS